MQNTVNICVHIDKVTSLVIDFFSSFYEEDRFLEPEWKGLNVLTLRSGSHCCRSGSWGNYPLLSQLPPLPPFLRDISWVPFLLEAVDMLFTQLPAACCLH
jgi:hypothetical protein